MHVAIQIPENSLCRMVPKHILSKDEVVFALGGSVQRVRQLRAIGVLKGKRDGSILAFSAAHVAEVAERYLQGEYDAELEKL